MKAIAIAFLGKLIFNNQELIPLFQDHLNDQDTILPHVLMAEITRWCLTKIDSDEKDLVQNILNEIENIYNFFDEIDELIEISFLENLPKPNEKSSRILKILGPKLKKQFQIMN